MQKIRALFHSAGQSLIQNRIVVQAMAHPLVGAGCDQMMTTELTPGRHSIELVDTHCIAGPYQRGDIVAFVYVLCQHGQIRLPASENLADFAESFRCHLWCNIATN